MSKDVRGESDTNAKVTSSPEDKTKTGSVEDTAGLIEPKNADDLAIFPSRLSQPVLVSDQVPRRHRRFEDGLEVFASSIGVAFVLVLTIYAQSTTAGVEEDVRAVFYNAVQQILLLPLTVLEGLFVISAPVALVIALARRGAFLSLVHTVLTGLGAGLVGWGMFLAYPYLPVDFAARIVVSTPSGEINSVNLVFMVLAAMATVAGTSSSSRSVKYTWVGIWAVMVLSLIRGTVTLPGLLITVLLGRLFGSLARWIWGFNDLRAMPSDLVGAALAVGLKPIQIVRSDVSTEESPLETWKITEGNAFPDYRTGQIYPPLITQPYEAGDDTFVVTPGPTQQADRQYQLWQTDGTQLDLHVLDPATGLTSALSDIWTNLRLRGVARLVTPSIKVSAERGMLAAATVSSTGVRTPKPVGLADAGSSIAVFWEAHPPTTSLLKLTDGDIPIEDATLDQAWSQLRAAHQRDVCHRNLDEDAVALDMSGKVWLLDWSQGEVGSSDLAQRIDCAQLLVHLSAATSIERAIASARRQIGLADLLATALVLQPAALPAGLRERAAKSELLDDLRTELSKIAPTEKAPQPLKLERFSPRTVVMFVILAAALVAVFGGLNFAELTSAVRQANPSWILIAFLLGATTWVGAAIPLVAFAPRKIRLWHATLAQMAASIVTLVAPAGIGPAALNLRFLNRQKLSMPVSVATVTLVQISQFLTSVALLFVVVVGTGSTVDIDLPTTMIFWIAAAVATISVTILSIPKLRNWIWDRIQPAWDQAYPQLLWVLGHPKKLGIATLGNLLMNIGYIGAFGASLAAFGYSLNPISLALTYLISTTIGSLIPTPGGIGPVEAALTAGLQVAGIPPAVALSTAVVFRLATFYGRIPFGWLALKVMEKKGLL